MVQTNKITDRWGEVRKNLKWLVEVVGETQQDLGSRLSVNQATISRWINREAKVSCVKEIERIEGCLRRYMIDCLAPWCYFCSKAPRYADNREEIAELALANALCALKVRPCACLPPEYESSILFSSSIVALSADLGCYAQAYIFVNDKEKPRHFLILVERSLSENGIIESLQTEFIGHVFPLFKEKQNSTQAPQYRDWHLWSEKERGK
jgi:hypothetical protein